MKRLLSDDAPKGTLHGSPIGQHSFSPLRRQTNGKRGGAGASVLPRYGGRLPVPRPSKGQNASRREGEEVESNSGNGKWVRVEEREKTHDARGHGEKRDRDERNARPSGADEQVETRDRAREK